MTPWYVYINRIGRIVVSLALSAHCHAGTLAKCKQAFEIGAFGKCDRMIEGMTGSADFLQRSLL